MAQLDLFPAQRPPVLRIELDDDEINVDNFAGGGGASTGLELATGKSPTIAINHCAKAIAVHRANHPTTEHYISDVYEVDPVKACRGRKVGLAWFSPDCKHHSKAKGGKPRDQKVRGLAWVAVRWAAKVAPRIIALENVEEFKDWGPLHREHTGECTGHHRLPRPRRTKGAGPRETHGCLTQCRMGKPIESRKGETFAAFVRKLERLGYVVEWRLLRACDYGAPTSRRRLFLQARRDGRPITWPAPTHGPGRARPYRTAAEIIDWTIPCPSIFGRKKPLADATMARIARGVQKFVIDAAQPFIVANNANNVPRSVHDPVPTVTTGNRNYLVTPFLAPVTHQGDLRSHPVTEPVRTITGANRGEIALAVPYLVHRSNGERPGQAPRIYDPQKPLGTIVAQGQKHAICTAFLARHYGDRPTGGWAGGAPLDKPIPTVTTKDHHALVAAMLVRYNGTSDAEPVDRPLGTLTTKDRYGLALVEIDGETYEIVDIGMRMLTPEELFAAQGFPADYQIAPVGPKGKRLTKTDQVKLCGNAVCPPIAAAIARAAMQPPADYQVAA